MHCGPVTEKGTLTDEKIMQYLAAYKNLKEKAPEMLEKYNTSNQSVSAGQEGFNDFESAIKEGGLSGYPEFVMLNAKIGSVFGIIQASKSMNQFETMKAEGQTMLDDGRAALEEQLSNPDVPEAAKEELRKSLEKLNQADKDIDAEYDNNSKWANFVMENANKITGMIVNEQDIELVKKHEAAIFEAYTGFAPPAGLDENFKAKNISYK